MFFTLGGFQQPEQPEERAGYFSVIAGLVEGDLATLAIREGWITEEKLAQAVARLREFANVPGSIWAVAFGQAIGRKPALSAARSTEQEDKMATEESSYTIGHKEGALALMRFRTAERCCAFFREHVRPDSRILDCGCGPGSITVGLAQWAPDGQTVGIDIGAEQLDGARALARDLGVKNVTFRQGDIFDLPFEDDSFDVVFSQTVLFHIPRSREGARRDQASPPPGGLVALRDAIIASIIIWPEEPLVREMLRMFQPRRAALRRQSRRWAGAGNASPRGGVRGCVLHAGLPAA